MRKPLEEIIEEKLQDFVLGDPRDAAAVRAAFQTAFHDGLALAGFDIDDCFKCDVCGGYGFTPEADHVPDLGDQVCEGCRVANSNVHEKLAPRACRLFQAPDENGDETKCFVCGMGKAGHSNELDTRTRPESAREMAKRLGMNIKEHDYDDEVISIGPDNRSTPEGE